MNYQTTKPILAIVTQAIRRDIHDPLKYFTDFEVIHYYHEAPYGDMTDKDFSGPTKAVRFTSSKDLYGKLMALKPNIIQGAEPYASRKALRFSLSAQSAAKKVKAKFIFPMLENRPASSRFGLAAPVVKKVLRNYAQKSDLIFTLNKGAVQNLNEIGIRGAKVVPLMWGVWGVDTELFSPKRNGKEPAWRLPTIIYIGRLVEEKGILDIIDAFKLVSSLKKLQLVFVGSGPMESEVKKYLASGDAHSKIVYLGSKHQDDLPPLLRASAMSIYPSRTTPKWEEQVGTVNLQAMSCGTPVISTQSGAIPEYVPDGKVGFLVPESAPQELAKAILAILNDKKLARKFGEQGRQYVLHHYDVRHNVKEGEKWIKKLISK